MKIEFRSLVEQSPDENLCIVIERHSSLYGSLMKVSIQVNGSDKWYRVMPSDLTTQLVVPLPPKLISELDVKLGQTIDGKLEVKEYKGVSVPQDIIQALEQHKLNISHLSIRQQRQGLLFIKESYSPAIRQQRIEKFIEACRIAQKQILIK